VLEGRTEKAAQGVTSEVVGNCGFSTYPVPRERGPLYEFANGILCGDEHWGWESAGEYLSAANLRSKVNVYSLAGHGSLRIAYAGMREGPLEGRELDGMAATLRECLDQGACGFSTGLMYYPGSSAPTEELERLCRVVAETGKLYTTHMRNYSEGLPEAVDEQLALAQRTGCRLQISHLQAVGAKNWALQQRALEKIERAAAAGLDVAFDCYPYVAGSTVLTQFLPQWALAGGTAAMLARFADHDERKRVISAMLASLAQEWTDLIVSAVASAANQRLVGLSLAAIASERACDPADAALDLLTEEQGAVNILEFNQSEANLRQLLTHPLSIVVSDGFYVKGRPHPRLCGAFPKLLGDFCRNRRWLELADAVQKITDVPARRYGMSGRGRLARGYYADVTVFDPRTVDSPATYENPEAAPVGIRWVFRNGRLSMLPGKDGSNCSVG
jgi:dihydroorotase/N-acyl-D-amino-acid deacylase